jgi:hypothetical protein
VPSTPAGLRRGLAPRPHRSVAADEWPDQCTDSARPVPAVGTYTGTPDADGDVDVLHVVLNRGEAVTIRARSLTDSPVTVFHPVDAEGQFTVESTADPRLERTESRYILRLRGQRSSRWLFEADSSAVFCLGVEYPESPTTSGAAWQIEIDRTDATVSGSSAATPRDADAPVSSAPSRTDAPDESDLLGADPLFVSIAVVVLLGSTVALLRRL